MLPVRTILHPNDFSPCSAQAFDVACALARDCHARLIVVHVAQPPIVIFSPAGDLLPPGPDYQLAAQEQLDRLVAPDPVRVEHCLKEGEAGTEILRLARESQADLIVMGTHGRTGLDRWVVGSVAEEVLRKAPCPVLTVKAAVARPSAAPDVPAAKQPDHHALPCQQPLRS